MTTILMLLHEVSYALQGLYEYVRPSWEERPRPKVDEFDMKSFGSTTPAWPTGTDSTVTELQIDGTVLPAWVSGLLACIPVSFKYVHVWTRIFLQHASSPVATLRNSNTSVAFRTPRPRSSGAHRVNDRIKYLRSHWELATTPSWHHQFVTWSALHLILCLFVPSK